MKDKIAIKTHEVVHVLKEEQGAYTVRPESGAFRDTILHGDAGIALDPSSTPRPSAGLASCNRNNDLQALVVK